MYNADMNTFTLLVLLAILYAIHVGNEGARERDFNRSEEERNIDPID